MIALSNVRKAYPSEPDRWVLKGIDLHIGPGELVAVVGASGSGKSTLLNILGGLDTGYVGSATLDGAELRTMSDSALSQLRNQRIGFVFQQFNLLDHLTCAENVKLPAYFGAGKPGDLQARARQALEAVGIGHKFGVRPNELSGGEKQRVAIARALFNEPSVLLCDEPTGSLDRATGDRILDVFEDLNRTRGLCLILVTHDPAVSARAHRVIRIEDGLIAEDVRQGRETAGAPSGAEANHGAR